MAGTKIGGKRAAATNKTKYGRDFYKRVGALGGKVGTTGGFAYTAVLCDCEYMEDLHKKAVCAGARGGTISKRGPSKNK